MLTKKTVVLGITGSIAAYKAADLASKLVQAGAGVKVIMTESACELLGPITLQSITGNPVAVDMWEPTEDASITHVSLAESADVVIIAPATASTIARIAGGIADDLVGCTVLDTKAPVIIAPAMHSNMYLNPVTQQNLAKLKARGFTIIEPESGWLASGGTGTGRLARVEKIIDAVRTVLGRNGDLAGKRLVVTAGGTQEPIDPVRHIGNRSSGKMGYAIAEAARDRGATVTLITAPASVDPPAGVKTLAVRTVAEMKKAVTKATAGADALVMAAAVSDYQPKRVARRKIKKGGRRGLTLKLVRTPDILAEATGNFLKIGFAAESDDVVANARQKLDSKRLDLIVANDITDPESGFEVDTNQVIIIGKESEPETLPLMSKREVAEKILDRLAGLLGEKPETTPPAVTLKVSASAIRSQVMRLPRKYAALFPEPKKPFSLATDAGKRKARLNKAGFLTGLRPWYRKHPELKPGDELTVEIIEPMKRYRLETTGKPVAT